MTETNPPYLLEPAENGWLRVLVPQGGRRRPRHVGWLVPKPGGRYAPHDKAGTKIGAAGVRQRALDTLLQTAGPEIDRTDDIKRRIEALFGGFGAMSSFAAAMDRNAASMQQMLRTRKVPSQVVAFLEVLEEYHDDIGRLPKAVLLKIAPLVLNRPQASNREQVAMIESLLGIGMSMDAIAGLVGQTTEYLTSVQRRHIAAPRIEKLKAVRIPDTVPERAAEIARIEDEGGRRAAIIRDGLDRGWTLTEISERIGLSKYAISRWIKGNMPDVHLKVGKPAKRPNSN